MSELIALINVVSGAPLHVLLIIAVYILWRRIVVLEDRLEECIKGKRSKP